MALPLFISAEVALWAKNKDSYGSYLNPKGGLTPDTLKYYYADPNKIRTAVRLLKEGGFRVTYIGKDNIGISASPGVFETVFEVSLSKEETDDTYRILATMEDSPPAATFSAEKCTLSKGSDSLKDLVAAIVLSQPAILANGGAFPPETDFTAGQKKGQLGIYQIPKILGDFANTEKRKKHPENWGEDWQYQSTGKDVDVYVIDDGFYAEHTYFEAVYKRKNNFLKKLKTNRKYPLILDYQNNLKSKKESVEKIGVEKKELDDKIKENTQEFEESLRKFANENLDKVIKSEILNLIKYKDITAPKVGDMIRSWFPDEYAEERINRELIKKLANYGENGNEEGDKMKSAWPWYSRLFGEYVDYTSSKINVEIQENELRAGLHAHGTPVIANLLAVAPEANVISLTAKGIEGEKSHYRNYFGCFSIMDEFKLEVMEKTRIFSLSGMFHGTDKKAIIEVQKKIHELISKNFLVLFAAGNDDQKKSPQAFFSSRDGYLSVGGCYYSLDDKLNAADSTQGYSIEIKDFLDRHTDLDKEKTAELIRELELEEEELLNVPTICGLSGVKDSDKDNPRHLGKIWSPRPRALSRNDWTPVSGSSFATPQVAGLCARIIQKWPRASPADIIAILKATATPVTQGQSADGVEPPIATGAGLVHIWNALQLTWLCRMATLNETVRTAKEVIEKLRTDEFQSKQGSDIPEKIYRLEINNGTERKILDRLDAYLQLKRNQPG